MSASPSWAGDPSSVYASWKQHLEREAGASKRKERWLSHSRLAVFVLGLVMGWLAFGSHQLASIWFLPPVLLFLILVFLHDRVIRRLRSIERTLDFFVQGLARLDGSWAGRGPTGENHLEASHPYAKDLDIFGEGSLFELLCTVRTAAGEELLASWLLGPSPAEAIRQRQEAVRELAPRVELRKDLSLLGDEIGDRISSKGLIAWGNAPPSLPPASLRWVAAGLTSLSVATLCAALFSELGAIPFIASLFLQSAFAMMLRRRVLAVLAEAQAPSHDLSVLSGLLARLEREPMEAERLVALSASLGGQALPPSKRIAQLRRLMDLLDARRNQFFAPIGGLLLWGTQLAFALERWRAECGPTLGPWIDTAAEMESLCALSGYAYENSDYVFPEILAGTTVFDGQGLGHPLIAPAECVRNDLDVDGDRRGLIMSGSNMSGKSTMLRTVGCAIVLGMAGAPVRATRLRLSPFQIGASIRINDSLRDGTSHFLAEIKRLRQIVDLTEGPWPVFFLLDEVLHGTNSHDRKIGAEAVVRGLLERGAVGIVTTHDLALARIADGPELGLKNVHFQDEIEQGRMFFDFKLRDGVVARSNAIELMRSVGLEV